MDAVHNIRTSPLTGRLDRSRRPSEDAEPSDRPTMSPMPAFTPRQVQDGHRVWVVSRCQERATQHDIISVFDGLAHIVSGSTLLAISTAKLTQVGPGLWRAELD